MEFVLCTVMFMIIFTAILLISGSTEAMQTSQSEPSVTEVQRAAVAYSGMSREQINKWQSKSRIQALLPRFQVEYERRVRDNINIDINDSVYVGSSGVTVGPEENTYTRDSLGDQNVTVKAVWMFNELIFNRDQLDIASEDRARYRERHLILSEVNKHYFKRKKLLDEIKNLKTHKAKRPEMYAKELAAEEETAALDALTGGWFSRRLDHGRP